jgi:hypothetical protein
MKPPINKDGTKWKVYKQWKFRTQTEAEKGGIRVGLPYTISYDPNLVSPYKWTVTLYLPVKYLGKKVTLSNPAKNVTKEIFTKNFDDNKYRLVKIGKYKYVVER